ncbi:MAG: hypothetical protein K2L22_00290 [Muribaculaceae bacterium]|nr:hypothetical protein [Muribaculaceae bacterium]
MRGGIKKGLQPVSGGQRGASLWICRDVVSSLSSFSALSSLSTRVMVTMKNGRGNVPRHLWRGEHRAPDAVMPGPSESMLVWQCVAGVRVVIVVNVFAVVAETTGGGWETAFP